MCVQGHIDTKVLAELTGQRNLELIDPSTTVENEIRYVQNDHLLYVNFEAVIDEPIWKAVDWTLVGAAAGCIIVLAALGGTMYFVFTQTKQVQAQAEKAYKTLRIESIRRESTFTLARCYSGRDLQMRTFMPAPPPLTSTQYHGATVMQPGTAGKASRGGQGVPLISTATGPSGGVGGIAPSASSVSYL